MIVLHYVFFFFFFSEVVVLLSTDLLPYAYFNFYKVQSLIRCNYSSCLFKVSLLWFDRLVPAADVEHALYARVVQYVASHWLPRAKVGEVYSRSFTHFLRYVRCGCLMANYSYLHLVQTEKLHGCYL